MLSAGAWRQSQPNTILFVLVDSNSLEVTGLGSSFNLSISKAGSAFSASTGTKAEIGNGWYSYVATAEEADTAGPVALIIDGAGTVQQNLEYVVLDRVVTAVEFTYTVTSTAGNTPLPGVYITITTDALGSSVVWTGVTDSFGVARDLNGNKPRLEPGVYYIFRLKPGYVFTDPDSETVSA